VDTDADTRVRYSLSGTHSLLPQVYLSGVVVSEMVLDQLQKAHPKLEVFRHGHHRRVNGHGQDGHGHEHKKDAYLCV